MRSFRWLAPSRLELGGWAFLKHIDLTDRETSVTVSVRGVDGSLVTETRAEHSDRFFPTRHSTNRWLDYDPSSFVAVLELPPSDEPVTEQILGRVEVEITTAGRTVRVPLAQPQANGAAKAPFSGSLTPEGIRHHAIWSDGALTLVRQRPVVARGIGTVDDDLVLETTGAVAKATLRHDVTGEHIKAHVETQSRDGGDHATLTFPSAVHRLQEPGGWRVRATSPSGFGGGIALGPELGEITVGPDAGFMVRRTDRGNLAFGRPHPTVLVDRSECRDGVWRIGGVAVAVDATPKFTLTGSRLHVPAGEVSYDPSDGAFEAVFPLNVTEWSEESGHHVPPAHYILTATIGDGEDERSVRARWSQAGRSLVPAEFQLDRYSVRSTRESVPVLEVLADVGGAGTTALYQRKLQQGVYETARSGPREDAVLFESFHGRNITCNPRAIWRSSASREHSPDVLERERLLGRGTRRHHPPRAAQRRLVSGPRIGPISCQ